MGQLKEATDFERSETDINRVYKKLHTLKMHVDHMDDCIRQTMDLIYEIEDRIMLLGGGI